MSDPINILPPQLTEKAKAVSQNNLLHVSVQVVLPSLGHGHGHGILPPPVPTLNFTGEYDVKELRGEQDLIV